MGSPRTTTLAAALLLLATAPAAAHAASAKSVRYYDPRVGDKEEIAFAAVPGEVNRLTITRPPGLLSLTDPAGITPLEGCERPASADAATVTCRESPSARREVLVALGDRDDALVAPLDVLARAGEGADVLRASGALYGEAGDDTLLAGAADENILDGGDGRDALAGARGEDRLSGGPGGDHLEGGAGEDDLSGGPGDDRLEGGTGFDDLDGDTGRNLLRARDRSPDDVRCGRSDRAELDALDMLRGRCGRCGRVLRRGAARAVPVGDLSTGSLTVGINGLATGVGCPADRARACSGSLVIKDGRRVVARRRFRGLRPGRRRQLKMRIGDRAVDRVGRGDSRVTLVVATRDGRRVLRAVARAEVL